MDIETTKSILLPLVRNLTAATGLRIAVAGGAVRDYLMGKTVKDIDLLIEGGALTPEQLAQLGLILGQEFSNPLEGSDTENYTADPDRAVKPVEIWAGSDGADLIVVDDIAEYVADFPDAISMAYVTAEGLVTTDAFLDAHAKKHFVYRRSAGPERLARLKAKYPDYTVDIRGFDRAE